eukprot:UN34495
MRRAFETSWLWLLEKYDEEDHESLGTVHIAAKTFDLVDKDQNSIGWPPLHRHHIHMYDATQHNSLRVFARHGDDECSKGSGGVACYYQESPEGHGYFFPNSVNVDYEINDDRDENSSPIQWWFQVALRLSVHKEYPLAKRIQHAISEWISNDR